MPNQQAFSKTLSFAIYILFLALGDVLAPLISNLAVDIQWLYVIKITAVIAALLYFLRNYTELCKRPPMVDFIYAGFAQVGSACLFALQHSLWLPVLFVDNWQY